MIVSKEKKAEIKHATKRAKSLYKVLKSSRKVSIALSEEGIYRTKSWVSLKIKER